MEEEIEDKHKLLDRIINYGLRATQKSDPRIASWIRLFMGAHYIRVGNAKGDEVLTTAQWGCGGTYALITQRKTADPPRSRSGSLRPHHDYAVGSSRLEPWHQLRILIPRPMSMERFPQLRFETIDSSKGGTFTWSS